MSDFANDTRSTRELFHAALKSDDDAAWDAISALHWRGTKEILERCLTLSQSKNAKERARAADILGQLGVPDRTYPNESFDALFDLLSDEDPKVVFAAIMGIQHLDRIRAAPHVLPYATHEDDKIRYAVAVALGGIENQDATATLLMLMKDRDAEVRNWATFGLGQQSEADSEEVRSALADRLTDDDPDVRYEAIIGLGRRRDGRALGFLETILRADPEDIFAREAAARLLGMNDSEQTATIDLLAALERINDKI